jgi:hypothetical protein
MGWPGSLARITVSTGAAGPEVAAALPVAEAAPGGPRGRGRRCGKVRRATGRSPPAHRPPRPPTEVTPQPAAPGEAQEGWSLPPGHSHPAAGGHHLPPAWPAPGPRPGARCSPEAGTGPGPCTCTRAIRAEIPMYLGCTCTLSGLPIPACTWLDGGKPVLPCNKPCGVQAVQAVQALYLTIYLTWLSNWSSTGTRTDTLSYFSGSNIETNR